MHTEIMQNKEPKEQEIDIRLSSKNVAQLDDKILILISHQIGVFVLLGDVLCHLQAEHPVIDLQVKHF